MKGMHVSILKAADMSDCTNHGITSKATSALLVGEGVPEIFEADENQPVLVLDTKYFRDCIRAVPAVQPTDKAGPMFGGNFIFSSDSRFPSRYPIPVHDRFE